MVSAFEGRLSQVGRVSFAAVTFLAGRNAPGGTVVMAGSAVLSHLGHLGVQFVVEPDRLELVGNFRKHYGIGRLGEGVF